jgi:hypothetical protein
MKTKTYNVYSFAELSGPARQRAIEAHREFLGQEWDGEATIDDAKQAFAYAGFDISEVHFSGFWSQGDGACFEGSWRAADVNPAGMREYAPIDVELHRIADQLAEIAKAFPFASFTVKHSGHYSHKYCTEFSVSIPTADGDEIETPERDKAEKDIIELARDAMEWIYRQLEKDYDWVTDEKQVIESLEGAGYDFTENGDIDS